MRDAGLFVLKTVVFVTIFWSLWFFVFRPFSSYVNAPASQSASQSQDGDNEALMKEYWRQARLADQIQKMYMDQALLTEKHQKRFEVMLATQEDLVKRQAEVIRAWEKQAGIRK